MDITPNQFNSLLRELKTVSKHLETLCNKLSEQYAAINAAQDRQAQQRNQLPIPLEIKLEKDQERQRETESTRQHCTQQSIRSANWATFVATLLAFIAAGVYGYIAIREWREMISVRHQAQQGIDAANRSAKAAEIANANATNADRPWVGIAFHMDRPDLNSTTSEALAVYSNSGRRPAKLITSIFYQHDYKVFPKDPEYVYAKTDIKGTGIIMPQASGSNHQPFPKLTDNRLKELAGKGMSFFLYSKIEYEDVITKTRYWTHGCAEFYPGYGWVNCASYNDTGSFPAKQ